MTDDKTEKILKEIKIEVIKYPCDLEFCEVCNKSSRDIWIIYKNKKYHLKCFIKQILEFINKIFKEEMNK